MFFRALVVEQQLRRKTIMCLRVAVRMREPHRAAASSVFKIAFVNASQRTSFLKSPLYCVAASQRGLVGMPKLLGVFQTLGFA